MKRTRIISIILTVCMLMTGVMPVASALAEGEISINVSEEKAAKDDEVTVRIDLDNCAGMEAIQFTVSYDKNAVQLISASAGDILESGISEFNTYDPGVVRFAFACAYGLEKDSGTAVSLVFRLTRDSGSAVSVSDGMAWRYDRTDGESKAYLVLKDGGISTDVSGGIPDPVNTPWIPETPTPSPSPTPSPTPGPTETPEPTKKPIFSPDDVDGRKTLLKYAAAVLILILIILGVVLIVLKKKDSDYDEV